MQAYFVFSFHERTLRDTWFVCEVLWAFQLRIRRVHTDFLLTSLLQSEAKEILKGSVDSPTILGFRNTQIVGNESFRIDLNLN